MLFMLGFGCASHYDSEIVPLSGVDEAGDVLIAGTYDVAEGTLHFNTDLVFDARTRLEAGQVLTLVSGEEAFPIDMDVEAAIPLNIGDEVSLEVTDGAETWSEAAFRVEDAAWIDTVPTASAATSFGSCQYH